MGYRLCEDCFKNQWLKKYIRNNGKKDQCCKCGKSDRITIDLCDKKFQSLFKGVFRYYYSEILYNSHWGGTWNWVDLLENENEIFNFNLSFSDSAEEGDLYDVLEQFEGHINNYDKDVSLYYGGGRMDAFMQPIKDEHWFWLDRLNEYAELNNPYFVAKKISNEIRDLIKPLEEKMFGDVLFRARIGIDEMLVKPDILEKDRHRVAIPYKGSKIGAPKPSIANDGRFNRKGTSYLYLASSLETAINEIRPSVGHYVSIGQFKINKEVKLIDFTKLDFYDYAFSDNAIEQYVKLMNLAKIMSIPNPDKQYNITQCFADAVMDLGYDGIKFFSSVADLSYNIVLFYSGNASYVEDSGQAVHIGGLKYEFENEDIQIKREYLREYQDVNDPQKDISKVLSDNFDIDNGNY